MAPQWKSLKASRTLKSTQSEAERIIAEELARLDWSEGDLAEQRKNDARKQLAIAVRLRRETTLSVREIAARVHLGTSPRKDNE